MGIKAHRAIKLSRGEVVATGGNLRVAIGGRGRNLMRDLRGKLQGADAQMRVIAKRDGTYDPLAEHSAVTHESQALGQIVRDRPREAFDFYRFCETIGPYTPVPFQPSAYVEKPALLRERAMRAWPLDGWALMGGLGALAAVFLLEEWWEVAGLVSVVGLAAPMAVRQVRARPGYAARLDEKLRRDFAAEQVRLAAAHRASEERKRVDRLRDEDLRIRLRESFGSRSPAPLTELVEIPLSSAAFPLPVLLDLDFDGFETAALDVILPEIDDIPEEFTSITHSGRLAHKKMERTQRCGLHEDAACGLVLRLVFESFRALPMTQRVTVRGLMPARDAAGKEAEKPVLTIDVKRDDFGKLNLTTGQPADLVRSIGKWGGNRKGDVTPVQV